MLICICVLDLWFVLVLLHDSFDLLCLIGISVYLRTAAISIQNIVWKRATTDSDGSGKAWRGGSNHWPRYYLIIIDIIYILGSDSDAMKLDYSHLQNWHDESSFFFCVFDQTRMEIGTPRCGRGDPGVCAREASAEIQICIEEVEIDNRFPRFQGATINPSQAITCSRYPYHASLLWWTCGTRRSWSKSCVKCCIKKKKRLEGQFHVRPASSALVVVTV